MNEPKLHAFVVSLVFASGRNIVVPIFAPASEGAVAIAVHQTMINPATRDETQLTSVLSVDVPEDWLQAAQRVVIEGGKPEGEVIHLVSSNDKPSQPASVAPEEAAAVERLRVPTQANYVPPSDDEVIAAQALQPVPDIKAAQKHYEELMRQVNETAPVTQPLPHDFGPDRWFGARPRNCLRCSISEARVGQLDPLGCPGSPAA